MNCQKNGELIVKVCPFCLSLKIIRAVLISCCGGLKGIWRRWNRARLLTLRGLPCWWYGIGRRGLVSRLCLLRRVRRRLRLFDWLVACRRNWLGLQLCTALRAKFHSGFTFGSAIRTFFRGWDWRSAVRAELFSLLDFLSTIITSWHSNSPLHKITNYVISQHILTYLANHYNRR